MITFTILLVALIILAVAVTLAVLAGGAGLLLMFGDVIVAGLIVWLIVHLFRRWK